MNEQELLQKIIELSSEIENTATDRLDKVSTREDYIAMTRLILSVRRLSQTARDLVPSEDS